jgi:NTP pyrophosphatase (non-canonical NTP hydrolase)
MNLSDYQNEIKNIFKNLVHPRLGSYIALTEEVGELGKEIMEKEIYSQTNDNQKIGEELCDVLISVLELSNLYNIDLEKEFNKKLDYTKTRISKWEKSLSEPLKLKRQKLD